jgi:hypothetical protein
MKDVQDGFTASMPNTGKRSNAASWIETTLTTQDKTRCFHRITDIKMKT